MMISHMESMIRRLFDDAPKLEGKGDQAPALECTVFLNGIGPVRGALSTTPEGGYKLLTQAESTDRKPVLLEMFFVVGAINSIAVERAVSAAAPSLIVRS